jgi:hypothetical protein
MDICICIYTNGFSMLVLIGSKSYRSSSNSRCRVTVERKEFGIGEYCGERLVCFGFPMLATSLLYPGVYIHIL